jgi:hypothetical protein
MDFALTDQRNSRFELVDLTGTTFEMVDFTGTRFRGVGLHGVVMRDVELSDVEISGEVRDVRINGVDVAPLVEAELDRRYPDRATMRATDADGFRRAWDVVERLWDGTVERARRLPPEALHESVDGEWSFVQTLRHLVFATDAWVARGILGEPRPWHQLSLPFDGMPPTPGVPRDTAARPSLDEVLEVRRERTALVRRVVEGLDEEALERLGPVVEEPGWPEPGSSHPARSCLRVVLNEEWEHRLYAERDLAVLEERASS